MDATGYLISKKSQIFRGNSNNQNRDLIKKTTGFRRKQTEVEADGDSKKAMFKTRLQKPMRTLNSNCKSKRGSSENGDLIRH